MRRTYPTPARERAGATRQQETANDQLKTHLRGPGRVLRSRLPDLVHQEIWAYLIVHHDQRTDRQRVRRGRSRPGPGLLRPGPAFDPPHRHRDGGHSPLRTGLTDSRPT